MASRVAVLLCIQFFAGLVGGFYVPRSASAATLPRSAEHLTSYRPTSHLADDQIDIWVARWFGQIKASDVEGSIAAIELLSGTPPSFATPAVQKLRNSDILDRVFVAANDKQKDRLRNLQVINYYLLRDLLWRDHLAMLQVARANKSDAGNRAMLNLISSVSMMDKLPEQILQVYMDYLQDDTINVQSRDNVAAMLRRRWADLKPQKARLVAWLKANTAGSVPADVRRRLALAVLARLGEPLSDAEINAVAEQDPASFLAMVVAKPTLAPAHVPQLVEILHDVSDEELWTNAASALHEADPAAFSAFYAELNQEVAAKWASTKLDRFIRAAVPEYVANLDDWTAMGTAVDCDGLRWRLSLLQRQTLPRELRFGRAWNLLAKESKCRDDLSREIDETLTLIGGDQLQSLLVAAVDKDGPGQLANMPLLLPQVSQSMADILDHRLAGRDLVAAKRLLDIGVAPSSAGLGQRNYWNQVFSLPLGNKLDVVDLRALRAVDDPPAAALATAKALAGSEKAGVSIRNAALMALAAHASAKDKAEAFLSAAASGNLAIARPAIILLAQTYDEAKPGAGLPLPEADVMSRIRMWPDASSDAAALLKTLVRYDTSFARGYAVALNAKTFTPEPGNKCLTLAEAPTIDAQLLTSVMNIAIANADAADQNVALACVAMLSQPDAPAALLSGAWRNIVPMEPTATLNALKSLWENEGARAAASDTLKVKIGEISSRLAQNASWSTQAMSILGYWKQELAAIAPAHAQTISTRLTTFRVYAGLALIPVAIVIHLLLWGVLLTAYPRFAWIQAVVFWNPIVRRLLGLGYIDLVLLNLGFARRRIFAPFKASLLGDIVSENPNQLDRISYFTDSRVTHRLGSDGRRKGTISTASPDQPILQALSLHKGRVVLLGKSGLGKSSFLRFSLGARARQDRDIIAYLRADQCRNGVEAQLEERLGGLARGNDLLSAMIYAGRIFIYIDGYNEVDLTTQDAITGFLARYPFANILVASQIPLRGFGTIETFEVIPLTGDAIRDFLVSREPVLADSAPVRGELFNKVAVSFLADVDDGLRDTPEKRAFDDILSNPMDLTSVAILLGDGRTPDLFALEAQQLEGIVQKLAGTGQKFRTEALSKALLEQRLQDQEDLQKLPFKPEVSELVKGKLAIVRTDADDARAVAAQEIRFRHDRIRDYFTHFAFLKFPAEKQAEFAQDARFAGVFPYLARALPKSEAEVLRERLITRAADLDDHRVSDSFVREFSWRQTISAQDPDWLPDYDVPDVRAADSRLIELTRRRLRIDEEVNADRDLISRSRSMTRILAAADPNFLRDAAVEILLAMGAEAELGDEGASKALLRSPYGISFRVVGLSQLQRIKSFHVEVLTARFTGSNTIPLIVTNALALQDPTTRGEDLDDRDRQALLAVGACVISARALYGAFLRAKADTSCDAFWEFVLPIPEQVRVEA